MHIHHILAQTIIFIEKILLFKVASTSWIAEFLRLDSNKTNTDTRVNFKRRLAVKEDIYEQLLSDPSSNMVLFSTVRHPLER